jgi:LmbE family N-acetylglucosaminyl deacetylase
VSALQWFPGTIAIISPHPDDETLGCGGLVALLARERDIHVVFVSDGARSPLPEGRDRNPDLVPIREGEARAALSRLGVPVERLHFLRFPDGRLAEHERDCRAQLERLLRPMAPHSVLVPFRYDWHPDHLAVYRIMAQARANGEVPAHLVEYFVYTQRRLLPGGDVRSCLAPDRVWQVDISNVARHKHDALACFQSQTTRFFDWQRRPILPPDVLARACSAPEVFLPSTTRLPTRPWVPASWVAIATALEPRLKRTKDALVARIRQ